MNQRVVPMGEILANVDRSLQEMPPPRPAGALGEKAAQAAMVEALDAANAVAELEGALNTSMHALKTQVAEQIELLRSDFTRVESLVHDANQLVADTAKAFRHQGEELAAQITSVSQKAQDVIAHCNALRVSVLGGEVKNV